MEIRESWSPPSKELARLGEKIEWINKDDFICFHCAQKQGQAHRKVSCVGKIEVKQTLVGQKMCREQENGHLE